MLVTVDKKINPDKPIHKRKIYITLKITHSFTPEHKYKNIKPVLSSGRVKTRFDMNDKNGKNHDTMYDVIKY